VNTLQRTLLHTVKHCNTLPHTATLGNTLQNSGCEWLNGIMRLVCDGEYLIRDSFWGQELFARRRPNGVRYPDELVPFVTLASRS